MHHASTEWVWVEVHGPANWSSSPTALSIDDGHTWADAEPDHSTTRDVQLPNGLPGKATWVRALSTDLGTYIAGTTVAVLVRITTETETPVLSAGSISIT